VQKTAIEPATGTVSRSQMNYLVRSPEMVGKVIIHTPDLGSRKKEDGLM